ncbi:hypothetical protein XBJ1_3135 [Xenorhabdus bovienii SS-2004]|uniref:Uncharacterized protein n=1 Tax=Xenorhabdus bovienii (strain SS-2004) TaxID=406818 RepID=D3V3M8_XENBS|nr:hypothetical protein XBJ1_3135 [Xenorhabdus bovienii SS-2004]
MFLPLYLLTGYAKHTLKKTFICKYEKFHQQKCKKNKNNTTLMID